LTKRDYRRHYCVMRTNFDTGDIEAFTAVGATLSFRLAANQLNISPSALSRRIQKLEEQLDTHLLDRTTRHVRLTLAGKQLLARAQEILANVDELVLSLAGASGPRATMITIAAIPSIAHRLLPAALATFRIQHPATRVRIRDLTTNEVVDAVIKGEADFGIASFVQEDAGLDFQPLVRGNMMAVMPPGHGLENRPHILWSELADHTVITTWKGAGIRMVMDVDLAREHERVSPFYEVRQMYTALQFVEAGLGIAPIPSFLLSRRDRAELRVVPLIDPIVSVDLGAIVPRAQQLRPLARNMLQALVEACEGLTGEAER
jgi:DNA-binding transcriptional LysR family regulator